MPERQQFGLDLVVGRLQSCCLAGGGRGNWPGRWRRPDRRWTQV